MIPFSSVPSGLRVPFVCAELDASRAVQGPATLALRALLIGQKLSAGTMAANTLRKVTSADEVVPLAGRGSMLHRMAKAFFRTNRWNECWIGAVADGAGTAGTKTITLTGPATAAGTICIYIAGERIPLAVAAAATAAAVGPLLAAAINAVADLPYVAAAGTGGSEHIVTLTHRHLGSVGNDVDVRVNYQDGEALPAGLAAAIATGVTGATDPVLTSLIAAMGDNWYHVIAHPYTDATSLTAIETEMARRFGPMVMIDGVAITGAVGSQGTLASLGNGRNSPHSCIAAQAGKSPLVPSGEYAASVAGVVAYYGQQDPAKGFQTLSVAGIPAPAESDRFTIGERELLLHDGIATSVANADGGTSLNRLITTYKTNAAGSADTSYLDVPTMLTLMYLRYSWCSRIASKFPRHKLANDGTKFGPGQEVVTPSSMKGEAVAWFGEMVGKGLVEDIEQFKANLVVERNATDPNRLDVLLPPDLINQLIVTATNIQFRL